MSKPSKHNREFKSRVFNEIIGNESAINQIARRESVSPELIKSWVKESLHQADPAKEKELLEHKRRINELEKTLGDYLLENYFSKKNILLVASSIVIIIILLTLFLTEFFNFSPNSQPGSYACSELDLELSKEIKKKRKKKNEYNFSSTKLYSITTKEGQKLIGKIIKTTKDKIFVFNETTKKTFTVDKKDILMEGTDVIDN